MLTNLIVSEATLVRESLNHGCLSIDVTQETVYDFKYSIGDSFLHSWCKYYVWRLQVVQFKFQGLLLENFNFLKLFSVVRFIFLYYYYTRLTF